MDITSLTAETFEPLVGEDIVVTTSEGPIALKITKVEAAGAAPEGMRAPFAVMLSGPSSPLLNQGAWPMTLPGLGETALFLSPFAQDDAETRYEILFG